MAVEVTFGYVNADGVNDAVTISPSNRVTGTQLRALVVAAWQGTGEATPEWVDGSPPSLVALVASHLGLPSGQPADWYPSDDPAPIAGASGEEADHEHDLVFDARQTYKFFGSPKRRGGKVLTCRVEGCGAMQVRGR